jgi:crotonobetainyl-CoA:carnitine CoA-transferase CaiB-like acyl-CoA transferase
MVEWMGFPLYYAYDGAAPPPRAGAAHATIYPYGPFVAGDGKTVMLGLQNEREWVVFCDRVLEQPALAADDRFASNSKRTAMRAALRAIIVKAFVPFTAAQVIARLDAAGIANAQMNEMHDVWAHPQLAARKRWVEVGTPAGPVLAPLLPGVARGTTPESVPRMDPVPALGEHTDAILRELGYDDTAIAALRAAKAV